VRLTPQFLRALHLELFTKPSNLMILQKVVTPVETGVQGIYKPLKILDSGFRRNDEKGHFQTFYETIKLGS